MDIKGQVTVLSHSHWGARLFALRPLSAVFFLSVTCQLYCFLESIKGALSG